MQRDTTLARCRGGRRRNSPGVWSLRGEGAPRSSARLGHPHTGRLPHQLSATKGGQSVLHIVGRCRLLRKLPLAHRFRAAHAAGPGPWAGRQGAAASSHSSYGFCATPARASGTTLHARTAQPSSLPHAVARGFTSRHAAGPCLCASAPVASRLPSSGLMTHQPPRQRGQGIPSAWPLSGSATPYRIRPASQSRVCSDARAWPYGIYDRLG